MPDFGGVPAETDAFRAEVRDWIAANFPASLKGKSLYLYGDPAIAARDPDFERWRKAMGEKGWGAPTWPREYGGGGLSREQAKVLSQELDRTGAWNPIGGMGVMMFGPTLLEYGNEAQKQRHIPPICRGELRWCQGFSEPGAGSDLASLQTRCEDRGDHWLVNGQKIWTSGAQWADWCFCLVRTDPNNKHEGISFLLIDMNSPGVEVRPILLISGVSPFCETFFTDVKVPKENLVGKLNAGWTIAKRLLQHERQGLSGGGPRGQAVDLAKLARGYVGVDAEGRIDDLDLRARLIAHTARARAFQLTMARSAAESRSGAGPSAAVSILKNAGSTVAQERHELALEIMGHQGLGWEGEGFSKGELEAVRAWLGGKAFSIYGGSHEIQNNIIAKRILGLLDHQ
ncbi:MAG: acyl-CoA dehydrogenase family protein [Caulobacteraceae bacterium]